jgi:hypothetical protein
MWAYAEVCRNILIAESGELAIQIANLRHRPDRKEIEKIRGAL